MTGLNHFSRFERAAQELIEGSFGRMFGKGLMPSDIALHVARAVEIGQLGSVAADRYRILLHPDDLAVIQDKYPDLDQRLTEYILQLAQDSDIGIGIGIEVVIAASPNVERRKVIVDTDHSHRDGESTQVNRNDYNRQELLTLQALDSFLIVDGKKHVLLDRPVMKLGRQIDNDIVLEAPTISRQHAQIRWRYGRFVIFDLGSRSGTSVNGQPISERVLDAGDVISLSNVSLIYGEGATTIRGNRRQPDDDGDTTLAFRSDDLE